MDAFDAWLAGFIDGEGSICISTAGPYPFVYVNITQHERSRGTLEDIQARYGGSISRCCGTDSFGRSKRSILRLDIKSQSQVVALLRAIEPHLRVKREQALNALGAIGDPAPGTRWTQQDAAKLRDGYESGRSVTSLAESLGRSTQAVYRKARLLGLARA